MIQNRVIQEFEKTLRKKKVPKFNVGDTVSLHLRIIEGNKERIQIFNGTVIAKKGSGLSETFSVYRHAYGSSMERVFMLHSPKIAKIEVVKSGKVRRAKLYYIRGASGKKAKLQELLGLKTEGEEFEEGAEIASEAEKPDVDESNLEASAEKNSKQSPSEE